MNKIIDNSALFSSEVDFIGYQSPQDAHYADFSIELVTIYSNIVIYQNRYYLERGTYGAEQLGIYNISNIINNYFERNNRSAATLQFTLRFYDRNDDEMHDEYQDQAGTTLIIYSKSLVKNITANELTYRFFSVNIPRFIASDGIAYLSYYVARPNSATESTFTQRVVYDIKYINSAGTLANRTIAVDKTVSYGVIQETVEMSYIKERVEAVGGVGSKILSFTVQIDTRTAKFYVDHRSNLRTFYFRNAFNVWDMLTLPTATTNKLKTDSSSTANIGNTIMPYDIEHTQTFEENSAAILYKSAIWLEQFFTSTEIRLCEDPTANFDQHPKIIITDYTSEVSNAPGTNNSVKFEWQYQDKRMRINFLVDLENRLRIFTDEFTEEYI